MGDGGIMASKGIRISTDSFSIQDVVKLMNVLAIKYRISSTIHMSDGKPRIYIKKQNVESLIAIVKPHIDSSMYYKLGLLHV
jgi:hypothetical protein